MARIASVWLDIFVMERHVDVVLVGGRLGSAGLLLAPATGANASATPDKSDRSSIVVAVMILLMVDRFDRVAKDEV